MKGIRSGFRKDTEAMEEIGFIYVLALSVILLSSIIMTVQSSTSDRRRNATSTFYQDVAHHISSSVQDVIDMHLLHPDLNYTRYLTMRHTSLAYSYRVEFTDNGVTIISSVENIRVTSDFYNPTGIRIKAGFIGDAKIILLYYSTAEEGIVISATSV